MSSKYKITPNANMYFITTCTHLWIPILTNEPLCKIILDSLKYCQTNKGLRIHSYVIMPSHIHALISHETFRQIPDVIRDFKRHTSKQIKDFLCKNGKFSRLFWVEVFHDKKYGQTHVWQRGYHPKAVLSAHFFKQKLAYIHANPVRKGYVEKPEYWKYSSARNYLVGDHSLLVIDEISW